MAQIARKLPSEAKPRTVNCDLVHFFLVPMDKMQFFFLSGEKKRFFRSRHGATSYRKFFKCRATVPISDKSFPLFFRMDYFACLVMYRLMRMRETPFLLSLFKPYKSNRPTRGPSKYLDIPTTSYDWGLYSFQVKHAQFWDRIPP